MTCSSSFPLRASLILPNTPRITLRASPTCPITIGRAIENTYVIGGPNTNNNDNNNAHASSSISKYHIFILWPHACRPILIGTFKESLNPVYLVLPSNVILVANSSWDWSDMRENQGLFMREVARECVEIPMDTKTRVMVGDQMIEILVRSEDQENQDGARTITQENNEMDDDDSEATADLELEINGRNPEEEKNAREPLERKIPHRDEMDDSESDATHHDECATTSTTTTAVGRPTPAYAAQSEEESDDDATKSELSDSTKDATEDVRQLNAPSATTTKTPPAMMHDATRDDLSEISNEDLEDVKPVSKNPHPTTVAIDNASDDDATPGHDLHKTRDPTSPAPKQSNTEITRREMNDGTHRMVLSSPPPKLTHSHQSPKAKKPSGKPVIISDSHFADTDEDEDKSTDSARESNEKQHQISDLSQNPTSGPWEMKNFELLFKNADEEADDKLVFEPNPKPNWSLRGAFLEEELLCIPDDVTNVKPNIRRMRRKVRISDSDEDEHTMEIIKRTPSRKRKKPSSQGMIVKTPPHPLESPAEPIRKRVTASNDIGTVPTQLTAHRSVPNNKTPPKKNKASPDKRAHIQSPPALPSTSKMVDHSAEPSVSMGQLRKRKWKTTPTEPVETVAQPSRKRRRRSTQSVQEEVVNAFAEDEQEVLSPIRMSLSRSQEYDPNSFLIMFTGLQPPIVEKYSAIVERLGGVVANDLTNIQDVTHLITDSIRRTVKFFCALSVCPHILSVQWLDACESAYRFVAERHYIIKDPQTEKKYDFKLKTTFQRRELAWLQNKRVFTGLTFYITPNTTPNPESLAEIIHCGDGQVVDDVKSMRSGSKVVVIANNEDLPMLRKKRIKQRTYCEEFILRSCMLQRCDFEINSLRV